MTTKLQEYKIDYQSLESGTYEVDYHIDKEFFEMFPDSLVQDGDVDVHIQFKVSIASLHFHFDIQGTLNVECDRCLELFDMPIQASYDMVANIDDAATPEEENDDLITISSSDDFIDLSKHIYEYVILSLPAQKVHPDDSNGIPTCNPDMLQRFSIEEEIVDDENDLDTLIDDYDDYDDDEEDIDFVDDDDYQDDEDYQEISDIVGNSSVDNFDGQEMETIEQKLSRDPRWNKLKTLLNKDIN